MITTYDDFKTYVKDHIKEHLPEEYTDAKLDFSEIKKSGGTVYEALMVNVDTPEAMKIVPALNITEAYRNYEQGTEIGEILDKLAETRVHATLPGEITREDIMDYGSAKGRIYPRLVNTAANAEYLADKPHCEVEDLSLLFAVRVHEDSQGFAEAIVNDDLAGMWGVDASELRETAMANLSQKEPFFANIEEVLFGGGVTHMPHEEFCHIEDISPDDYSMPFYVLSNAQKTKGAVMAMDPKTMGQITDKLGDVYVIPSSVDEVLVVPKDQVDDVSRLAEMVTQVNADAVAPQDQLSNNVYEYDAENQTLAIASDPTQDEIQTM